MHAHTRTRTHARSHARACVHWQVATHPSADGTVSHEWYRLARAEVFLPKDAANAATTELTSKLLEIIAQGMLDKMRDPRLAHTAYLSSQGGVRAAGATGASKPAVLGTAHADTVGLLATNDMLSEGVFGTYTYIFNKYGTISPDAASAVAQAKVNGDFELKTQEECRRHSRKFGPQSKPKPQVPSM